MLIYDGEKQKGNEDGIYEKLNYFIILDFWVMFHWLVCKCSEYFDKKWLKNVIDRLMKCVLKLERALCMHGCNNFFPIADLASKLNNLQLRWNDSLHWVLLKYCANIVSLFAAVSSHIEYHLDVGQYEPELFPGLIYRMKQPKIVLLIFVSGKIVLTGAKVMAAVCLLLEFLVLSY